MMKNSYFGNGGFLLFYSELCIPWTCGYINIFKNNHSILYVRKRSRVGVFPTFSPLSRHILSTLSAYRQHTDSTKGPPSGRFVLSVCWLYAGYVLLIWMEHADKPMTTSFFSFFYKTCCLKINL